MYCTNCGAEIGEHVKTCPYCGKPNEKKDFMVQKDIKIQELEQKIVQLEAKIARGKESHRGLFGENRWMILVFIFPLVFFIMFFTFFIILVRS
ncbi:MAG: zinc-ribbon domain-containing protein [Promethearchaeota archaeon]